MRLALLIEGQEGPTWEQWCAIADTCEASELETLLRSDHYVSGFDERRHVTDAWATIAGLAARTTRVRLGTLVSPVTFRHPAVLARAAATADEISGGRIEVGIGAGWVEREHAAYGFAFPPRRTRLELLAEQVEIVRRLFTEESVTFHGSHYRLELAPGLGRPAIRIIVGGKARGGTTAPAARFADEYNTIIAPLRELETRVRLLDEACERIGRDPSTICYSLMTPIVVARSEAELRRRAAVVGACLGRSAAQILDGWRSLAPVGTVDEVLDRLRQFEAIGYERAVLQNLAYADLETVELIGGEISCALA